jgi:hypothetical protein
MKEKSSSENVKQSSPFRITKPVLIMIDLKEKELVLKNIP